MAAAQRAAAADGPGPDPDPGPGLEHYHFFQDAGSGPKSASEIIFLIAFPSVSNSFLYLAYL